MHILDRNEEKHNSFLDRLIFDSLWRSCTLEWWPASVSGDSSNLSGATRIQVSMSPLSLIMIFPRGRQTYWSLICSYT